MGFLGAAIVLVPRWLMKTKLVTAGIVPFELVGVA